MNLIFKILQFGLRGLSVLVLVAILPMPSSALENEQYEEEKVMPRSAEVLRNRVNVKRGPSKKFKLRGIVVKGARLPVYEMASGAGCPGHKWVRVFEKGWICGRSLRLSDEAPFAMSQPVMSGDTSTPWSYAFVKDWAIEYKWTAYGWLEEVREIFKGFGFAVARLVTIDGRKYYETPERKLIPRDAARVSKRVSDFAGIHLENGAPWPVGWVNSKDAWLTAEPVADKNQRVRKLVRYDRFNVVAESGSGKNRFYQLDSGEWVRDRDVRVATTASRPVEVEPDERWIDVDVGQQVLTAYRGDTPVFVTMVSTGRYGASKTIKGAFRIWVKVAAIAMDNTDEVEELEADTSNVVSLNDTASEPERKLYSLQDVPWTQFFEDNFALHAVYWHNRFGNRKSHGCVNLSPRDARWLYSWTSPSVPAGFWSIYSVEEDRATIVRVR